MSLLRGPRDPRDSSGTQARRRGRLSSNRKGPTPLFLILPLCPASRVVTTGAGGASPCPCVRQRRRRDLKPFSVVGPERTTPSPGGVRVRPGQEVPGSTDSVGV